MNWIQQLHRAYKNAIEYPSNDPQGLSPAGFTRKNIKFNVILNENSEFIAAELLDELCLVPSLPDAESRTSGAVPYPLADQLKYFVSTEKNSKRYYAYLAQLTKWAKRGDAPESLRVIKQYVEKNTVLQDMCAQNEIEVKFHKSDEKEDEKGPDASSFICFSILHEDGTVDRAWEQADVKKSWEKYITEIVAEDTQLCYAEGKVMPVIFKHPKIEGNAKLISGKDSDFPFQYKGLFIENRSSMYVSYEASICAHNMLLWLLSKQGFRRYGMLFVAWNTNGTPVTVPIEDNYDFENVNVPAVTNTDPIQIRNASIGNNELIESISGEQVCMLGMRAATNGRVSITYYQELDGNTYLARLRQWYKTCRWSIWRYDVEKKLGEWGLHTPTPEQIAVAVLGQSTVTLAKQDVKGDKPASKLMCQMRSRLLPCIMDGTPLPLDFARNAFDRATLPMSFTNSKGSWSEFKWRQNMAVACALIRKYQYDRTRCLSQMDLDEKLTGRDYLFGRLLAIADIIEHNACKERDRQTNAIKYMRQFIQMPNETWLQIHQKLIPYLQKLGNNAGFYQRLLSKIEMLFNETDRQSNAALTFDMLLGYCAQRAKLFEQNTDDAERNAEYSGDENESQRNIQTREFNLPVNRDALYGCLMAVADVVEIRATRYTKTDTSALKMMNNLFLSPVRTWGQLHSKLIPYLEKMDLQAAKHYQYCMTLIESSFNEKERADTLRLRPETLHAYYCARYALLNGYHIGKTAPVLENQLSTRDAVYGKLLSIENQIERVLLDLEKPDSDNRFSNALRLMQTFSYRPDSTWQFLKQKMTPYIDKARRYHMDSFLNEKIVKINSLEENIKKNGWNTDDPLDGSYLYSFYFRGLFPQLGRNSSLQNMGHPQIC